MGRPLQPRRHARHVRLAAPPARRARALGVGAARALRPARASRRGGRTPPARPSRYLREHWREPCFDWWEEREGVHAATVGSIWAATGDEAARAFARRCYKEERLDGSHAFLVALGLASAGAPRPDRARARIPPARRRRLLRRRAVDHPRGLHRLGARRPRPRSDAAARRGSRRRRRLDGELPEQVPPLLHPDHYDRWTEKWHAPAQPLLWSHAMYLTLRSVAADMSRIAVVGSGLAALVAYATLRAGGVATDEIVVYGDTADPAAAWRTRAAAIRQRQMRSESDGHPFPRTFPGLAVARGRAHARPDAAPPLDRRPLPAVGDDVPRRRRPRARAVGVGRELRAAARRRS